MEQISCDVAKRMILNYVDGELEGLQRAYLKSHIKSCTSCHKRYRILRHVRDMLQDAFAEFRPTVDLTEGLIEKLPDKYPQEGFDPASIRNIGLAGKEKIYTPPKAPLTARQFWVRAGIFVGALLLMGLLIFPLVRSLDQKPRIEPPELMTAPFRSMAPSPGIPIRTGDYNGVFELPGDTGYGILFKHSILEREYAGSRYMVFSLMRGDLFFDGRGSSRRVQIRIGPKTPQDEMRDSRILIDSIGAQATVSYLPNELYPDRGTVVVTSLGGDVSVSGHGPIRPGTRLTLNLEGGIDTKQVGEILGRYNNVALPETQIDDVVTDLDATDDPQALGKLQERLGSIARLFGFN